MKLILKTLYIIFLFSIPFILLISCDLFPEDSWQLKAEFDQPPDSSIENYVLYRWGGLHDSLFSIDSLIVLDTLAADFSKIRYSTPYYTWTGKVIRAVLVSIDTLGRKSDYSYSPFYDLPLKGENLILTE